MWQATMVWWVQPYGTICFSEATPIWLVAPNSIELQMSTYICKEGKTKICLLIIDCKYYYRKIEITEEEYDMLEKGIISL